MESFENLIKELQPKYDKLNSNYSKSYLKGSIWYVGDDLMKWWNSCNNIRYFRKNKEKLYLIQEFVNL